MKNKLFRTITNSYPKLKYKITKNSTPEELKMIEEERLVSFKNCHFGQYKLFYTEFEFLELVSHHLDLSECLIFYVGSASGSHLNLLLEFYPMLNMLLYDPGKFEIKESKNVKIKTGQDGFFDDSKIPEVLEYANGRKILFISDIRLTAEDEYERQKVIYHDIIIQQKWAIALQSEFMLFKFRMFYYKDDPKEVNFMDNSYANDEFYKTNCIIQPKENIKYDDMLYLSGSLYVQLYSPTRSGESRLFVSKIKYRSDANLYKPEDQQKYVMQYYNNLDYEYQLNYFNIHDRNKEYVWGKSDKLAKYIPGMEVNYTSACEYFLIYRYLKRFNKSYKFEDVLATIIKILTFMNTYHHNNLVVCQYKHFNKNLDKILSVKQSGFDFDDYMNKLNSAKKTRFIEQVNNLKTLKGVIDKDTIDKFIVSYNFNNKLVNIYNGTIKFKNYR
jgi:hypothetical protein